MATIPRADTAVGIRDPQALPGVTQAPNLQLYVPQQYKAGVQVLKEEQERLDRQQVADAKIQFELGQIEQREKYKDDPDLDTINDRYAAGMRDHLAKAGAQISNGALRDAWLGEAELAVEVGKAQMAEEVEGRMADRERGEFTTYAAAIVKDAKDPNKNLMPGDAMLALTQKTDSMVERRRMTAQEQAKFLTGTRNEIALGRLKAMDPFEQLQLLDAMGEEENRWAREIPSDVQQQLREQAEAELGDTMAVDFANQLALQEPPPDPLQARRLIREKFANAPAYLRADIMRAARTEYHLALQDRDLVKTEKQIDTFNQIDLKARDPGSGITLAKLNNKEGEYWEQWSTMDPAQRANVENYLRAKATGVVRKHSDRGVYLQLRSLYMQGGEKRQEAIKYFLENNAQLNDSDFKQWEKMLLKGEPTSLFDHQTRLLKLTEKWNWEDQANLLDGLDRRFIAYQQANQMAEPPDDMVNKWIREDIQKERSGKITIPVVDIEIDLGEEYTYSKDAEDLVDTFELHLESNDPAAMDEFMDKFDAQQQHEIRYNYLKRIDQELDNPMLDEIIAGQKVRGLPYDMETIMQKYNEALDALAGQ